jgi:dipeptidyl aminopeptidase/acylaminoacyl peptidase
MAFVNWEIKILRQTVFSKIAGIVFCLFLLTLAGGFSPTRAQDVQSNGAGDVFPVPDTYKVEGIPTIKKSEVENLFYDPSAIRSNLIWDADSKNRRLLVTDEKNSVYLLDTPMAQPVRLTQGFVPSKVKIRSDGTSFAYNSDQEDEDNYQLYFYDFKEKTPKKLTTLTGKDESVESFAWTKAGDALLYTKVDYDTKTSKLCRSDLSAETCFSVDLKGVWTVVEADGDYVLLRYAKASSSHFLYAYDLKAKKLTPVDEQGDVAKAFLIGAKVFWLSDGNNACRELKQCILVSDLKNVRAKRFELPKNLSDFDDARFSPAGNSLLVQESKNGIDNLRVFRLKKDKIVKEMPPFVIGTYVIWNTRWLTETEIAYTLENNGKPASIQSYDIDSKKRTDWTKEKLPVQLEGKVKSPEVIKWKSFDGKEISGFVVHPAAAVQGKKSPVLIYVHGGPQILDKPVFSSQDIRLASNLGLTIIHTNIRGSTGFGKEFENADNREKRGDAVKDIQALIDWVGKQPELEAGQIYLRGESYGGFVVLSTALQETARIKGVIAEYPLVSIRGFLSQSWIDEFARNEYGDPKDEQLMKRLDELSPLNNVSRWNNIPLFLTRGKLDQRNPEKDVTDLKTQLQNKNSPVWFIYSNEDGHGFSGRYVTAAMFKFLKTQISKEQ